MKTILWTTSFIIVVTVQCSDLKPEPPDSQLNLNEIAWKMSDEETAFDPWNFIEGRRTCTPTKSCIHAGGHCVKGKSDCNGITDRFGCRGGKHKCKCCIPDNTTPSCPAAVTCAPCPTTGSPTKDELATHELWLHILLQLDRPYEDRRTTYRGDDNYAYYLDNEIYDPNEPSTPIFISTMEDFTTGKGRFKNLLNYPKGRGVVPSMFDTDVKEAVNELYTVYKENPGAKGILKVAVNAKDHVNEYLHVQTLIHAIIYDKELYGYGIPAFHDVLPELFTKGCNDPSSQCCQVGEYPPNLTEDEWKISYFREDAGFNNFHGSWHLYNPWANASLNHGELFFYFHNQLVARYNMERLSNELDPVTPLDNWNSTYLLPHNYNPPVLTDTLTRCADMSAGALGDQLSKYRTNLKNAIMDNQIMKEDGSFVSLQNDDGIKYVGCALERAYCGDLNHTLYGPPYGIHNTGHGIISQIGCPGIPANASGVMGNPWPAVRDPIFFRWHKFVDDIFQLHKKYLDDDYSLSKLALDGVSVSSIGVYSTKKEGQLLTFNSTAKLTMWFDWQNSTCIEQPSSNHYPFTYNINVDNNAKDGNDIEVNVRIYLAPKPKKPSLNYEKLRTLWALMDRFNVTLKSGSNTIKRDSCSSSITVPRPKSLQELSKIYKDEKSFNDFRSKPVACHCGLPEYLLIPRGTPEGMPYQLFVYITPRNNGQNQSSDCPNLECGDLCSKDYTSCLNSDSEPMGFPFDRPLKTLDGARIKTIEDMVNKLPNAMLHDIKIFYNKDVKNNNRQCNN